MLERLVGRVAARYGCAALYRVPPIRARLRPDAAGRESSAAVWLSSAAGGSGVFAAFNCRSKASMIARACSRSTREARYAARSRCGLAVEAGSARDRSVHAAGIDARAPNAEATFQVVDAGLPVPGSRLDHDVLVVPLLVSREICLARSNPMPQGSPAGHQGAPERWFSVGTRVVQ